jgi:N-acetylneuraminate synthase
LDKIFIVAEAGVNHNGSLDLALRLVDRAAQAGADAVKFQTFKADKIISRFAAKAEYQKRTTGSGESQLEMVRRLELGKKEHRVLVARCRARGIAFLSTPFDRDSLHFLARGLHLPMLKLPSGELTNAPLLLEAARAGVKVVLSTGMSNLGEVEEALGVLAYGYRAGSKERPSRAAFQRAYATAAGQAALRAKVTLLHCTTEYPAPFRDVNLRAMDTLSAAFGCPVGYSDHTEGLEASLAAAARGAVYIEKHFTLDRGMPGPDHKASLEPDELDALVKGVRAVAAALGSKRKAPALSELKNIPIARKSLVAARKISRGERFTAKNLEIKRPGDGISPMLYWDWLGRRADRAYEADELIGPA